MTPAPEPVLVDCRRDEGTVTLSLSDGEILEVAPDSLPENMPAVGEPLPAPLLDRLRAAAERKRIARRLFQLLNRRLYAIAVLQRKLQAEGFDRVSIKEVLAQFAERGLHSDRKFALAYCRDSLRRRPVGRRLLRAQLHQRQVSGSVADEVVAEVLTREQEEELALQAGRKRWLRSRPAASAAGEAAVVRFLMGRGFGAALARRVARRTAPEQEQRGGEAES